MHRATRLSATFAGIAGVVALGACAVVPPPGPTVMALPGQGKSFPAFQQDDVTCRGYAEQQTGYQQPGQAGTNAAVGSAVLGYRDRRGGRRRHRRGSRQSGRGRGDRRRDRPARWQRDRRQQRRGWRGRASAALRHRLHAVHVRARQLRAISPVGLRRLCGSGLRLRLRLGYPAYPYYAPGYYGPSLALGFGFGGGWGWGHGWGGGWHSGGWHGGVASLNPQPSCGVKPSSTDAATDRLTAPPVAMAARSSRAAASRMTGRGARQAQHSQSCIAGGTVSLTFAQQPGEQRSQQRVLRLDRFPPPVTARNRLARSASSRRPARRRQPGGQQHRHPRLDRGIQRVQQHRLVSQPIGIVDCQAGHRHFGGQNWAGEIAGGRSIGPQMQQMRLAAAGLAPDREPAVRPVLGARQPSQRGGVGRRLEEVVREFGRWMNGSGSCAGAGTGSLIGRSRRRPGPASHERGPAISRSRLHAPPPANAE